jgi:hypothetical protein
MKKDALIELAESSDDITKLEKTRKNVNKKISENKHIAKYSAAPSLNLACRNVIPK